jgi:glycosyltransferase involved in cell wall biosynthesis
MKQKIPVLHIIKSLGRGGAETLLPEMLNKHDKDKYEFHYAYFLPWKGQMVSEIQKEGGKVTLFSSNNNLQIMAKVFKLVNYVKTNNIQLIHCHLPWAGIVGRIVGSMTKVPVVYTEHNVWERYHKLTYHLNKLSYSKQKTVIAVSQDVANSIHKNYHKPNPTVKVVLNGINTEKFSGSYKADKDIRKELNISSDAVVIGVTCVFRPQKRLTDWVEVAAKIHEQYPGVHFIVVGDGMMKNEIFKKAKELNTEGYVHFVGLHAEIRPYLRAMDIFMMTSEFEGLPIALLEAMSMGCMPACTDAGGISELVKDEQNGILVPVATPLLLAEKLASYLNDRSRIEHMSKCARNTVVRDFSMQKMVAQIETIYDETIK